MRNVLITWLFSLLMGNLFGQGPENYTYVTDPNTGMVQFNSNLSSSDLHFYVFSDGYFFNGMHPNHFHYPGMHSTTLFNLGNKEEDDPREEEDAIIVPPHNGNPSNPYQPISLSGAIEAQLGWNVTSDYNGMIALAFQNDFSSLPSNGCINFQYNANAMDVSIWDLSTPSDWCQLSSIQPGMITWTYENLAPDEQRVIYLNTKSTHVAAGSNLGVSYSLAPNCTNPLSGSTVFTSSHYPHDPNQKIVTNVDSLTSTLWFPEREPYAQKIVYEVEFHNSGSGPVTNVSVEDEIHIKVDPSSLEFLGASHSCTYNVSGNMLHVQFDNINLPGLDQTLPSNYSMNEVTASYRYSVCVPRKVGSECLDTDVEIFFDDQDAIQAENSICAPLWDGLLFNPCEPTGGGGAPDGGRSNNVPQKQEMPNHILYPNPTADFLYLSEISIESKLTIRDETGKSYEFMNNRSNNDFRLDVRHLKPGFYILEINSEDEIRYEKFIKIN